MKFDNDPDKDGLLDFLTQTSHTTGGHSNYGFRSQAL